LIRFGSMGSEAGLAEVCDALADFDQRFASFGGGPLAAVGTGPHDDSTVAKQYAKDLNAALADPTAPWAQSLLTATSEDLSNADSATLQTFFAPPNNGAQLLANLSVALAPPSDREPYGTGPAPSDQIQLILGNLGTATAAPSCRRRCPRPSPTWPRCRSPVWRKMLRATRTPARSFRPAGSR
jgi:hypothetical protein